VVEGELEPGAGVWCYCCRQEVARHVTDKQVSIEWGGLLEHMTSPTHHKRTRHFWWANGAERNQMQTYLLFSAEYKRYPHPLLPPPLLFLHSSLLFSSIASSSHSSSSSSPALLHRYNVLGWHLLFYAYRFKSRVAEVLQQLETTKEERIKKVAEEMRAKEELQSLAAMEVCS